MQQVEASIGERDPAAGATLALERRFELVRRMNFALVAFVRGAQRPREILARDHFGADAGHFDTRGQVCNRCGRREAESGNRKHAEHAQHHVAGACHVVNFARHRRDVSIFAAALGEIHPVAIERYQARLEAELAHESLGRFAPRAAVCQAHPGRDFGFVTIRRERSGAAVDRKVFGPARIDNHRDTARAAAVDQRAQHRRESEFPCRYLKSARRRSCEVPI